MASWGDPVAPGPGFGALIAVLGQVALAAERQSSVARSHGKRGASSIASAVRRNRSWPAATDRLSSGRLAQAAAR